MRLLPDSKTLLRLNSFRLRGEHLDLLAGHVANLQAGLQHAQDGVAIDHADNVFVGNYGHLVDVFALHALQDCQRRLPR
jgi:sugar lactone lactonase YvrE